MEIKEYSLVLPAKIGESYWGGWAPGSVPAHALHIEKGNPGVSWVWKLSSKGLEIQDREILEAPYIELGKIHRIDDRQVRIAREGFFYESHETAITWQFEAECIIRSKEEFREEAEKYLKEVASCVPLFRQVYNSRNEGKAWGDWLIIKKLKRIQDPIHGVWKNHQYGFPGFSYFSNKEDMLVELTTSHLTGSNAFVVDWPKKLRFIRSDPEKELSDYLRRFLTNNPPVDKLREANIHDAFILALMRKGYKFESERMVSSGRYDVVFEDPQGKIVVVELKLGGGEPALEQLQGYVEDLKDQYGKAVRGVIVCGKSDEALKKAAKEYGFSVVSYQIKIEIPIDEEG